MVRPVRIGNAHGFWGDRLEAAGEMLAREPDLDFLTLDFLAEVSMSILAQQRSRDPQAGWPRDFIEIVRSIASYWREGGRCRVITNAGGLNPPGCARACCEVLKNTGCAGRTVAVVCGDDVLDLVARGADLSPPFSADEDELLRNLDTDQTIAEVRNRIVTANAYLGAKPIAEALARGADLVITGRVADPSLTVAPCAQWFGWSWDEWDRLAGATVAGHLIECGTQLCGGISSDWLQTPEVQCIGFPIAEVASDGSCVVTKTRGSGGRVCAETVKEQLLYEIGDPDRYLSPDATVSLLALVVDDCGADRVAIRGARGHPAPATYKVSATYQDGFWAQGELTLFGSDAYAIARRAGEAVLQRLETCGISLRESVVECLGGGACRPQGANSDLTGRLTEIVLRIAVADPSREAVERFSRELMPLITAGPPGTTGYAEGRPRVHPLFRFWPCLIARDRVQPQVTMFPGAADARPNLRALRGVLADASVRSPGFSRNSDKEVRSTTTTMSTWCPTWCPSGIKNEPPRLLRDLAYARSGDKGIHANVGVIARRPDDFPWLCRELTAERVATYFGIADSNRVVRYELPNLTALNFVLHGILASPLRVDAQGKALAQVLLEMPLEEPSM
jgi:hypothetical protein